MTDGFLDVWHGDILSSKPEKLDFYQFLNADEKEKASTFARPELQKKYIKTRGVLRKVLGTYLNEKPQEIIINTGEYGKPFINESSLYFNLSHAGNKFVIAVSNCGEVGVDIELYKNRKNLSRLVDKCFSDVEKAYWQCLPEEQKVAVFYRFWVRKEAFVKAVGRGIALGLNRCVVNPENQIYFLNIPDEYGLINDWKIVDVKLNKDDACAVVIKDVKFNFKQIELE